MKKLTRQIAMLMAIMMCFGSLAGCGTIVPDSVVKNNEANNTVAEEQNVAHDVENLSADNLSSVETVKQETATPEGDFNEGVVLVKADNFQEDMLGTLSYAKAEPLYPNSSWYEVTLNESVDTEEAVNYLKNLGTLEDVDFDYVMAADGEIESIDISANTESSCEVAYLTNQGIFDAWGKQKADKSNVGGSSDVIIAIIDTGVDYNHVDLRDNIWVNTAEIPNNGIDDDGNGYVDDYYGWDFVWDDNDPMDDNGHGTHVAGIAAADNNLIGTIGVAFNCKIMCLKAGNASGYFNSSDIAEAVQYAYMNGASVINMSFGGSSISTATKTALEDAYNSCVLVAAAGNNGLCNQPDCIVHIAKAPFYPAALTYVIGVMSCNATGTTTSSFSNYDHYYYNSYEYEVYACGEQIISTFPNNKYATLSGTSMASPIVAGIAALLRSEYSDTDKYSTKFIQSQIVNTGVLSPDGYHKVANPYLALTTSPTPSASLCDIEIYDGTDICDKNNGNGVIDAGETVHIGVKVMNIGGVASNVKIKATLPEMETAATLLTTEAIDFPDIGTYSIQNGGYIYSGEEIVDETSCFVLQISENAPNSYAMDITFEISYKNGMDDKDTKAYAKTNQATVTIQHGESLPIEVTEDMTLSGDKLYFLDHDVTIYAGATLTIEAGAKIEIYTDSFDGVNSPNILNYGTLIFNGSEKNHISIEPTELYKRYFSSIVSYGKLKMFYCDTQYLGVTAEKEMAMLDNCSFYNGSVYNFSEWIEDGKIKYYYGRFLISLACESISITDCCFNSLRIYTCATNTESIIKNNLFNECGFYGMYKVTFTENFVMGCKMENGGPLAFSNNIVVDSDERPTLSFTGSDLKANYNQNVLLGFYCDYKSNGLIEGYRTTTGTLRFDLEEGNGNFNYDVIWPYVTDIKILNKDGEEVHSIGKEQVTFEVYFNRDMDTTKDFYLYFGTKTPYADYKISGTWETAKKWVGTYTLTADIENGAQYFKFGEAYAADDSFKELLNYTFDFTFTIDTTSALSMNLQPVAEDDGISLTWVQDDYDTLMGYNVYRSTDKDGNYVKLNTSVIPASENTFKDENAEPGKSYWYTFTVVLSDMSESNPAGKVSCTAKDTLAPNAYHTPVNQGYLNNNLVISCTASDNVAVQSVTLYYRTTGASEWKTATMAKQNDRYSASIYGSELSLDGLEYYIVVTDGISTISKGTADSPYSVIIKDASAISTYGDVDGDGTVTTKDALMLMQAIETSLILTDDQFKRADLNKDNVLSSVEALRILQYINGNVSTLTF